MNASLRRLSTFAVPREAVRGSFQTSRRVYRGRSGRKRCLRGTRIGDNLEPTMRSAWSIRRWMLETTWPPQLEPTLSGVHSPARTSSVASFTRSPRTPLPESCAANRLPVASSTSRMPLSSPQRSVRRFTALAQCWSKRSKARCHADNPRQWRGRLLWWASGSIANHTGFRFAPVSDVPRSGPVFRAPHAVLLFQSPIGHIGFVVPLTVDAQRRASTARSRSPQRLLHLHFGWRVDVSLTLDSPPKPSSKTRIQETHGHLKPGHRFAKPFQLRSFFLSSASGQTSEGRFIRSDFWWSARSCWHGWWVSHQEIQHSARQLAKTR